MRFPAFMLPVLAGAAGFSFAGEKPVPRPEIKRVTSLAECPAPVRAAVDRGGWAQTISEIRRVTAGGSVTYSFETGTEENGEDRETSYHFSDAGLLLRTEEDIPLKQAPEKVRSALLRLAGRTHAVDDVERVTADGTVSYQAELESNGGEDRRVKVSADGAVLELAAEQDD